MARTKSNIIETAAHRAVRGIRYTAANRIKKVNEAFKIVTGAGLTCEQPDTLSLSPLEIEEEVTRALLGALEEEAAVLRSEIERRHG
jgi:hypothetical protein